LPNYTAIGEHIRPAGGFVVFYPAGAAAMSKSGGKRQTAKPRLYLPGLSPSYSRTLSVKHATARPSNHPHLQNFALFGRLYARVRTGAANMQ